MSDVHLLFYCFIPSFSVVVILCVFICTQIYLYVFVFNTKSPVSDIFDYLLGFPVLEFYFN